MGAWTITCLAAYPHSRLHTTASMHLPPRAMTFTVYGGVVDTGQFSTIHLSQPHLLGIHSLLPEQKKTSWHLFSAYGACHATSGGTGREERRAHARNTLRTRALLATPLQHGTWPVAFFSPPAYRLLARTLRRPGLHFNACWRYYRAC